MRRARILAIAEKETYHILRDPFTLAMALLLPVMMVVLFGLCIEFNVKNIPISVYDGSKTRASSRLFEVMGNSDYFIPQYVFSPAEALKEIDRNKSRAALIVGPHFESELLSGRGTQVQVLLDGSDSSTVVSVASYISGMTLRAAQKITGITQGDAVEFQTRYLYNPELNSRWFSIPGLLVIVLAILSTLLTSLTISREWENGSMELLLSTPVQASEIIVGKLAPYLVLGLASVALVYWVARVMFDVPFRGNHAVFLLGCALFLAANLAQGLLISALARQQQLAMQLSMQTSFLPAMLLSGFIFPIESMPLGVQWATALFPARWFMEISRSIFLQGSGLYDLRIAFAALSLEALVLVVFAVRSFKTDVEP